MTAMQPLQGESVGPSGQVPHQRRSGYAQRRDLSRGLERMAREAEQQDPGHDWLSPLLTHLSRLAALPPGRTDHDFARLAAAMYGEPIASEPITDEIKMSEAR